MLLLLFHSKAEMEAKRKKEEEERKKREEKEKEIQVCYDPSIKWCFHLIANSRFL